MPSLPRFFASRSYRTPQQNRAKYPKDKARGRADKYTAYVSKEEEGKGGEKRKRDETEMRNEQTKSE